MNTPIIGITMGDPVGIGPEIILSAITNHCIYNYAKIIIIGDINILNLVCKQQNKKFNLIKLDNLHDASFKEKNINVLNISNLCTKNHHWGKPTSHTSKAMEQFIITAVNLAMEKKIDAMVTCPINKAAMKMANSKYSGHTEMLAHLTGTKKFFMMLAGEKLKVVLVTIHIPLAEVHKKLTHDNIYETIIATNNTLISKFGKKNPRIAVAGLNPHAGESEMFGNEETKVISPAIKTAADKGINISGPHPPDTVFYHAASGSFDAVVCMYHDQGLIPFKMIHFSDGVNTTLGLPIIRTSVDHGTAYDIAGKNKADSTSLASAVKMAATQSISSKEQNRYNLRN